MGDNPFMDINKVISSNIKRLMQENPALDTFKKVAAKAQIGFGTVQRAHNGSGNVTASNLHAIAKAFGVPTASLFESPTDILQQSKTVYLVPKTKRQKRIDAINGLLAHIDETGLAVALDKCRDLSKEYPVRSKETQSS